MDTNEILLSPESYNLLSYISSHPDFSPSENSEYSFDCLNQLLHYKLVICSYTCIDIDSGFPVDPTYSITELGKGYLYGRQSNDAFQRSVKNIANSAKESADSSKLLAADSKKISESAKTCADIALKKSQKADIKGWISLFIAALSVFIEFAIHHAEATAFIKSILEL